jgi:hypothetical protein
MERLWKKRGGNGTQRFGLKRPRNHVNIPNLFATGCDRSPSRSHGKEGVDAYADDSRARKLARGLPTHKDFPA